MSDFVPVAKASEIPDPGRQLVEVDDQLVVVFHAGGSFYAIDDVCTHDGGTLGEGRLRNGRVICPRHGAAFDARTGKAISLPAVKSVRSYAVTVEDGGIFVDCDAPIEAPR